MVMIVSDSGDDHDRDDHGGLGEDGHEDGDGEDYSDAAGTAMMST